MAKEKSPAFQFYPRDFLADLNVQAMTMEERGIYLWLLCHCWVEGTLPADVSRLARICGIPGRRFARLWPAVAPCFTASGDTLTHRRLDRERQKQAEWQAKSAEAGRASAKAREAQFGSAEPRTNREPTVNQPLNQTGTNCEPDHEPSCEPMTNSASAVCSLQFASAEDGGSTRAPRRPTQGAGVMAGTLPRDHLRCVQPCGRVCFPQSLLMEFARLKGGADEAVAVAYVRAWQWDVNAAWGPEGARAREAPGADKFAFWRARWDEDHPAAKRGKATEDVAARLKRELGITS